MGPSRPHRPSFLHSYHQGVYLVLGYSKVEELAVTAPESSANHTLIPSPYEWLASQRKGDPPAQLWSGLPSAALLRAGPYPRRLIWPGQGCLVVSPCLSDPKAALAALTMVLESLDRATPVQGTPAVPQPLLRGLLCALVSSQDALDSWRLLDLSTMQASAMQLPGTGVPAAQFSAMQPQLEAAPGLARVPGRYLHAGALPNATRWNWLGVGRERPARLPDCGQMPVSYIPLSLHGQEDAAIGRALSYPQADLCAFFEAFERSSSLWEGQSQVRTATPRELMRHEAAVDPVGLLQYEPEDIQRSPVEVVPYRPDVEIDWVRGYSARRREEVWVPARHVYLGYDADAPYMYETSSGVAVGGCPEEAMLHALLEVIERDAFLMTWYARQRPRRLRLDTFVQRPVHLLLDHLEGLGYHTSVYDVTQESRVPSVWVQVRRSDGMGPFSLNGAAAHLTLERAVSSALVEVVGSVGMLGPRVDAARGERCWADPDQITGPDGHFQRYAHPQGAQALSFLDEGEWVDARQVAADAAARFRASDLTINLQAVIRRLLRHHPDVVFVDLSTPRLRRHGLHCVRALVPGSLPMTFGHRLRRVQGCVRLMQRLRHSMALNPLLPHPFP